MESQAEQAFLRAFDEHADALFRHASFRVSDRERARDIVQDAFLKTWDYIAGGGTVHDYRSFLYRAVHNLIIDEYRKKRPFSLDGMLEDETSAQHMEARMAVGGLEEVQDAIDAKRDAAAVREAIHALPETYRSVLVLRYLDGLSTREIAKALEVSENVVSVRIHRAVAKLKQLYAHT